MGNRKTDHDHLRYPPMRPRGRDQRLSLEAVRVPEPNSFITSEAENYQTTPGFRILSNMSYLKSYEDVKPLWLTRAELTVNFECKFDHVTCSSNPPDIQLSIRWVFFFTLFKWHHIISYSSSPNASTPLNIRNTSIVSFIHTTTANITNRSATVNDLPVSKQNELPNRTPICPSEIQAFPAKRK